MARSGSKCLTRARGGKAAWVVAAAAFLGLTSPPAEPAPPARTRMDPLRRCMLRGAGLAEPIPLAEAFEGLSEIHPLLYRHLKAPVSGRWRRSSDPGWAKLHARLLECAAAPPCPYIRVTSRSFDFEGAVERNGDALVITIGSITTLKLKESLAQDESVWGRRTDGVNSVFTHTLGVLMDGIADSLSLHPELSRVALVAEDVKNPQLNDMFQSLGFRPFSAPRTLSEKKMDRRGKKNPYELEKPVTWGIELKVKGRGAPPSTPGR